MKGSWRVGKVAGIGFDIHITFPLFIAFLAWEPYQSGGISAAVGMVSFLLSVFVCVLLHELGHAFAAKYFGIRTHDITLLPIGGVARLERMPEKPSQELVVALAGPLVNVVIVLVLLPWVVFRYSFPIEDTLGSGPFWDFDWLTGLLSVNVVILLFNLLPAFPMDGGRVLRSLLAFWLTYHNATRVAVFLGRLMAVFFVATGFWIGQYVLMLIGVFVFVGAGRESVKTSSGFSGARSIVDQVMSTQCRVFHPDDSVSLARIELTRGEQQDFPVIDQGAIRGLLCRRDILLRVPDLGSDISIKNIMRVDYPVIKREDSMQRVLEKLDQSPGVSVPVLEGDRMLGLVTADQVLEYLANETGSPAQN
ncbi:MAG: site-2 protease family protein [Planctomycetota bacterium]|nr:site-2 protease family protein [Planctomycetota bacterium]